MKIFSVSAYRSDMKIFDKIQEDFSIKYRSEIIRLSAALLYDILYLDDPAVRVGSMEMFRDRFFMKKKRNNQIGKDKIIC
jgi:hypothetical protein